jgi:GNAT superfamily N-acetyltransferase
MSDVEIRRVNPEDEPALGMFLHEAYCPWGRFKYPERWRWQFVQNPLCTPGAPPVWIALDRGRIVGQVANTPVELEIGQTHVRGVNQGDLIVRPEYRRSGIAGALMAASLAEVDFALDLWVAPISRRILDRLGYLELPIIPWLQHQPTATAPPPAGDTGVDIVRVDRFGPESDALWERIGPEFGLATSRNVAYLNWKFTAQPHMGYEMFEARQGTALRGIAVVRPCRRPEPDLVVLAELIVSRGDPAALTALCEHVRARYAGLGKTIVAATSVTEYRAALRSCGFVETAQRRPVSPFLWCRQKPADLPRLVETMLVGRSDSDWDQYPYAGLA